MKKGILLLLLGGGSLVAGPCTSGLLSAYTTAGFNCTINQFTFQNFFFGVGTHSTSYTPIAASDISVAPALTTGANGAVLGLGFSSTLFSVTGTDFANYEIRYNIDPPPDIIIETEDQLSTNTPVAPGYVDILTKVCVGGRWTGSVTVACDVTGGVRTLHVFHDGTPVSPGRVQLFDSTIFPGVHVLGIDNFIALNANGASSSFTGITNNTTAAPEPAAMAFVLSGLAVMAARRLRMKAG
jgi:hypothetical protein